MTASEPTELRRALVTGATGFIGGHLVRYLASHGWDIHALARQELSDPETKECCTWHRYDGSYESVDQALSSSGAQSVFHLASLFLSEHQPTDLDALVDANLRFGTQLLEAMYQHRVKRLVNAGTSWQHFGDADYDPVNLYASTKQAFEAIIDYYCNAHNLSAITLKLYDTYGPEDHRKKLVPYIQKCLQEGRQLEMTDGLQQMFLVHVDDVSQAFSQAHELLSGAKHLRFGLPATTALTVREIVAKLAEKADRQPQVAWGQKARPNRHILIPPSLPTLPGWRAKQEFPVNC